MQLYWGELFAHRARSLTVSASGVFLCLTIYPFPLCRGCLFITYELEALDKAVTIDTRAILQEKYKSYIYLKATPSDEKENLTAGNEWQSVKLPCKGKTVCQFFLKLDRINREGMLSNFLIDIWKNAV